MVPSDAYDPTTQVRLVRWLSPEDSSVDFEGALAQGHAGTEI